MKKLIVSLAALLAAAGLAVAPVTAGERTTFSAYIDDLPIMPGLEEGSDGYIVDLFQGGRLAEARFGGTADAGVIRGFYAATLTQLGWKALPSEPYVYQRGRERLTFTLEPRRGRNGGRAPAGLDAVFMLTPDTKAGAIPAAPQKARR